MVVLRERGQGVRDVVLVIANGCVECFHLVLTRPELLLPVLFVSPLVTFTRYISDYVGTVYKGTPVTLTCDPIGWVDAIFVDACTLDIRTQSSVGHHYHEYHSHFALTNWS